MPRTDDAEFYQLYFQAPGVAEEELQRDPRKTVHTLLFAGSGDSPRSGAATTIGMVPRGGGFLRSVPSLPLTAWLTQADVDFYAAEFARTGFRGGLNWYRNIDRNWELLSAFKGAKVRVPALFMAGDRDLVMAFKGMSEYLANMKTFVPELRESIILPGCGHWIQQERAAEVNAAMTAFVRSL